jgi:hypothetical protein
MSNSGGLRNFCKAFSSVCCADSLKPPPLLPVMHDAAKYRFEPPPMKWSAAMFMPRINAIRQISGTEQTYCRWKKKYGATGTKHLKELKRLQTKNQRLRRAVSDLTSDKLILSEAARGNF